MSTEILVIPFPHAGHIFPATELANHLAARNHQIALFLPSTSSSIALHPRIRIVEFSVPHPLHFPPGLLEDIIIPILAQRFNGADGSSPRPICAIVDEMMSWLLDACQELQIPAVSFFTSSACSTALQRATSQIPPEELNAGRIHSFPGLPNEMAITASDFTHRGPTPGHLAGGPRSDRGPRRRGLTSTSPAIALLINTCDQLERVFLDYLAREAGKPVWGVGPLLPLRFWDAAGSAGVRDGEVRPKRESSVSEKNVIEWLDAKPRGSVIYVSFGTLVGPTDEELGELAAGLEESNRPFIWVIQTGITQHGPDGQPVRPVRGETGSSGFSPDDLARRTQGRGLVIQGWAPQLTILTHVATGAYVCHCGWNSTLEALGCGVPVLTWPVRGDQMINAKLLTNSLKVGFPIRGAGDGLVTRADVVRGIEKLMADEGTNKRAASLSSIFAGGFPMTSSDSLDAFVALLGAK